MIDFQELPADGTAFEQLIRELCLIANLHPEWTGKGPDQGRDLVVTEKIEGELASYERKWLVQCKHNAHSGSSVGRGDIGSVLDDCRQVGASGYLLVTSTQPSSGLVTKLREISMVPENRLVTAVWDSVDLEKKIRQPRNFSLGHLFFPESFSGLQWQIYNDGAPNLWTANYREYFLHLSSRISARYPDLSVCEAMVGRLESIDVRNDLEHIRPRALYYDDKSATFVAFADYLVPIKSDPSLSPRDFDDVLCDGQGLGSDDEGMWDLTTWDIELRRIIPFSDHFDKDHYDYYVPYVGSFRHGFMRGSSIGCKAQYGNRWEA